MVSLYEPESPEEIAERARATSEEARAYLRRFATVGVIEAVDSEYRRPPESVAVGAALRLLPEADPGDITDGEAHELVNEPNVRSPSPVDNLHSQLSSC